MASLMAPFDLPPMRASRVTSSPRRVLLRLPNWLGDICMAAPTVAAIARACPEAELTAQAVPPFLDLAALLPGVDGAMPAGRDRGPGDLLTSRAALRARDFDTVVVFPRGARAMLAPRLAGIPVRVGYGARGHALLLTHAVDGWRPWRRAHRSAFFGGLAHAFGTAPRGPWALAMPPDAETRGRRLLRALGHVGGRPLVVLEGGASYGPAKCWAPQHFGALARRLIADGCDVVTVGTAAARGVEARIAREAGGGLLEAVGRTPRLLDLIGLLGRADLLVANDTGPMHLAAALGTPVVALFGATDPTVSGPAGPGPRELLWDPEPCSPCFLRTCPVAGHPCLEKLGVARVHGAVRAVLDAA